MYKENIFNNGFKIEKTPSNLLYVVKNELYVPKKNIIIPHSVYEITKFTETHKGGLGK